MDFSASERRVCGLMEVARMSFRYQSCRDDSDLRVAVTEISTREAALRLSQAACAAAARSDRGVRTEVAAFFILQLVG